MSPRLVPAAAALVLLLAACGDDDDGGAIVPAETTTTAVGDTTTTGAETVETTVVEFPSTTAAEPAGQLIEVEIAGGEPVGGVRTVEVPLDETVTLRVTGDAEGEFHVHGYDLIQSVGGDIVFVAAIPGQFEVELEGTHTLILELVVA